MLPGLLSFIKRNLRSWHVLLILPIWWVGVVINLWKTLGKQTWSWGVSSWISWSFLQIDCEWNIFDNSSNHFSLNPLIPFEVSFLQITPLAVNTCKLIILKYGIESVVQSFLIDAVVTASRWRSVPKCYKRICWSLVIKLVTASR